MEFTVNADGHKVFKITDRETGEVFEHVQVGRGRPPLYSPATRAARKVAAKRPLRFVAREDLPVAGERAVFIPVEEFGGWEQAVRHMQVVEVDKIRGKLATILLGEKRVRVPLTQLVSVE